MVPLLIKGRRINVATTGAAIVLGSLPRLHLEQPTVVALIVEQLNNFGTVEHWIVVGAWGKVGIDQSDDRLKSYRSITSNYAE